MELPNVDINLLEKPSFESVQPVELAHLNRPEYFGDSLS